MPNQRVNGPYGAIFSADTPALDRVGQLLYQEQRVRQHQQQQENAQLEDMMRKEVGKARGADTADIVNGFTEWKNLRKNLLFNKDLQKDPVAYNKAQQEANAKLADTFATVNKSSELAEQTKDMAKARMTNPDLFKDDFGNRLSTFMQTPLSKLGNHNWDDYRETGSDFNVQKALEEASGPLQHTVDDEQFVDDKKLQSKITPYEYGKSPAQVKESLIGAFALKKGARAAAAQWDNIPQEEKDKVDKLYSEIPADRWRKMGVQKPQELSASNPDNKADQYATYLAKKYAIVNEPRPKEIKYRDNTAAVMNQRQNDAKELEALKSKDRQSDIYLRKSLAGKSAEDKEKVIDKFITNIVDDAKAGEPKYNYKDGKILKEYPIKASERMKDMFKYEKTVEYEDGTTKKETVYPSEIRIGEDGTVKPIYLEDGKMDMQRSQPMMMQEFKARLGKDIFGTKAVNEAFEDSEDDNDEDDAPPPPKKSTPKKAVKPKSSSGVKWH